MSKPTKVSLYPNGDVKKKEQRLKCTCDNVGKKFCTYFFALLIMAALITFFVLAPLYFANTQSLVSAAYIYVHATCEGGIGELTGQFKFDTDSRIAPVSWWLVPRNMTDIISIGIYGPIQPNAYDASDSLVFAVCGLPSSLVCTLNGTIAQGDPGGFPLNNLITGIRSYGYAYYFNVSTTAFPTLSCRGTMGISAIRP